MDIFVRNIPVQATEKSLQTFFRPILGQFGIENFACHRFRGRGFAVITVLEVECAKAFLIGLNLPVAQSRPLKFMGRRIWCESSRRPLNDFLVKVLQKEKRDKQRRQMRMNATIYDDEYYQEEPECNQPSEAKDVFPIFGVHCGLWDYDRDELVFVSHLKSLKAGTLRFGQRKATVILQMNGLEGSHFIEMPYDSIQCITPGGGAVPSVTFSLDRCPRMYTKTLADAKSSSLPSSSVKFDRVSGINDAHLEITGNCLVYRFLLLADLELIMELKNRQYMPTILAWTTRIIQPCAALAQGFLDLEKATQTQISDCHFELKFQLQKLTLNNHISPWSVLELLPVILEIAKRSGDDTAAAAVKLLSRQIPFAGPATEARELCNSELLKRLIENEKVINYFVQHADEPEIKYDHITRVYQATVTPAGIYLHGPQFEGKNRVLRCYPEFTSHFLRVSFVEEDGRPLRFDQTNHSILYSRFSSILNDSGIKVAGRVYKFLGFSNSSLRQQTCWFMAPFVQNGELLCAESVIARLGDFSLIRCPAKCAARIGQAFSETPLAIPLKEGAVKVIDDVKGDEGRLFSDGVGTVSREVLEKIWEKSQIKTKTKPTVYQIRYAGAKGMISYDPGLMGEQLCLRPSMIKFQGRNSKFLEICAAGDKPFPMFLNRQLIKLLEDLGVPPSAFLELQQAAVEDLRKITLSAQNAASYLELSCLGTTAQIPWLLRTLDSLNLSFQSDGFLCDLVEITVLIALRELKHRSRIPVAQGFTLFGVMDETGYLGQHEVYCTTDTEQKGRVVLTQRVAITRSPALHPGDIQMVQAIDVPEDSPLRALHNCVVFSQKGSRDLPSQLSGGDLDGDLYNIIFDESLFPKEVYFPAQYPRVEPQDIGRPVESSDMADFFLQFMEMDKLGRIATLHQVLADKRPLGILDYDCLRLAKLHSTAVDFSKTGIPADLRDLPRDFGHFRPDFMANGPRATIQKGLRLEDLEEDTEPSFGPDKDFEPYRYYESDKVLGQLYRAIDEQRFFSGLQRQARLLKLHPRTLSRHSLLGNVWEHINRETQQVKWRQYIDWARGIRELYEDNLIESMHRYAMHPAHPLDELEAFLGSILGKYGAQSKHQREKSVGLRAKVERDISFIVDHIVSNDEEPAKQETAPMMEELNNDHGPPAPGQETALAKSIACLFLEVENGAQRRTRSYGWVVAGVCLKELEKWKECLSHSQFTAANKTADSASG
ncbi:RdRP-domain-containing protein [Xylona heveae TC161]|uniref:RNA-dependent RNA polymerase n=1 Tax=Xylona heveae (strain CBS 132557 / TC161) TaxID=1328760 RepID=A0A164ZJY2_XYLHT|nr:RdRP-domain-containing protein [Xylona heveae TC161]KZF19189.1 RdRP-domain-containing protein [Xylona heveae TC161]